MVIDLNFLQFGQWKDARDRMRVREVRISGLRAAPVAAHIEPEEGTRGRVVRICWTGAELRLRLPWDHGDGQPLLGAIVGANSAGKSTILLALHHFFGTTVKLDPCNFHAKRSDRPIVVEVTLAGRIDNPTAWHMAHCTRQGDQWQLTVASVWQGERRSRYTRRADGRYVRQTPRDRAACERLLPEWRVIWADRRLQQETNLERKSLLSDLIDATLAAAQPSSAVGRMVALLDELAELSAQRHTAPPDGGEDSRAGGVLDELEAKLSAGLGAITPQPKRVHLDLAAGVPSLRQLFAQSVLQIDDGVALDLDQHGLGMQRSLVVSLLHTWCEVVRRRERDYLFAVEEPELYLHPHATRVLLNLLEKIGAQDQVLFTTHAHEFVNRTPLANVAIVRRVGSVPVSRALQLDLGRMQPELVQRVNRYLQEDRSDMLFARAVLLVEGQAEYFALPAFARTLGLDLDGAGVSVVFVNGIGNFGIYHEILAGFGIPHVVILDGDGQRRARQRTYAGVADALFVLDVDFEHALAAALAPPRLLALVNACLARRGQPPRDTLGNPRRHVKELVSLGKPLVGRMAGEMMTPDEIEAMPEVAAALRAVLALAQTGAGAERHSEP